MTTHLVRFGMELPLFQAQHRIPFQTCDGETVDKTVLIETVGGDLLVHTESEEDVPPGFDDYVSWLISLAAVVPQEGAAEALPMAFFSFLQSRGYLVFMTDLDDPFSASILSIGLPVSQETLDEFESLHPSVACPSNLIGLMITWLSRIREAAAIDLDLAHVFMRVGKNNRVYAALTPEEWDAARLSQKLEAAVHKMQRRYPVRRN